MLRKRAFHRSFIAVLLVAPSSLVLRAAEIPKGAHLLLRMVNSVTTRTARAGDQVYMRTASPIAVSDRIVVPVNSYVQGAITSVERGGRVSGRAALGLRLDSLTLPSGRTLRLSGGVQSVDSQGSDQRAEQEGAIRQGPDRGRDAARIMVTAGSGAALGAMIDRTVQGVAIGSGAGGAVGLATVLLTRGRDVELRQGATLDVVLDRPLVIE
jgi:type IV secretion system protein VirB10